MAWLAATYHLPSTYTCRMPMSSPVAARALPTPGPATVRLALISNAIELVGLPVTRDVLFPVIRAMPIRIRPPESVAISQQQFQVYKGISVNKSTQLQAALGYREMATASGSLVVYVQLERRVVHVISEILYAIGAWGSGDSLTYCETVTEAEPTEEVVVPLQEMSRDIQLSDQFIGLATEFRDQHVSWEEIIAGNANGSQTAIVSSLWAWPLRLREQRSTGFILRRCSWIPP